MIRRFGHPRDEDRATLAALWHALGEIYRSRLKDYRSALRAFEMSLEITPGDDTDSRQQIVRELRMLIE